MAVLLRFIEYSQHNYSMVWQPSVTWVITASFI